jgi:RimJ/RimL family protein N-acetyltransferase
VLLRDVLEDDLHAFFRQQLDPDANTMAAFTAKDNIVSIRVLEKCGFVVSGHDRGFANVRGEEIDELILKLEL